MARKAGRRINEQLFRDNLARSLEMRLWITIWQTTKTTKDDDDAAGGGGKWVYSSIREFMPDSKQILLLKQKVSSSSASRLCVCRYYYANGVVR